MNDDRRFRRLVFAAALLSIFTYAVADESWALGVLAITLAVVGWTLTERRAGRAVPRALIALAIIVAIGWAIASGLRDGLNVAHFCQFTIAVLVIKAFDRRTSADLGQFVMLSLFLSIGALLTSNSLWMAMALLPTLLYCVAAGVAYQFHLGRAGARRALPRSTTRTPARAPAAPARIPGVSRLLGLGWIATGAIAMFVFLLFPRSIGADSFGRWGNASVGMVTGFTSEVNLGEGGLISTSAVPVLDLTVRAPDGQVLGAPEETYYLRGAVLDEYDHGKWRASSAPVQSQLLPGGLDFSLSGGPGSSLPRASGSQIELDIMVRNARSEDFHLFTLWRPRRIQFESQARIQYTEPNLVITRRGQSGRVRYTVQCEPLGSYSDAASGAQRTVATFNSRPIAELAASILREGGLDPDPRTRSLEDDAAAAARIERFFGTGFSYTLDITRVPNGRDPIEWFLLDHQQGHCEYYASAMVALCRSVGINARVVTGFVATEFNDATRHYVVRESNAHAWVEVEVAPGLWQTRDPTPSGEFRRIHRPDPTILSQIRGVFEAINYAWITSVVAFDDTTRASFVSAMQIDTTSIDAWAEEAGRRIRSGGSALIGRALQNALMVGVGTALLGITLVYGAPAIRTLLWPRLVMMWLRLRRGSTAPARAARLAESGFYARLLGILSRRGLAKPSWRPPLDHARSIESPALAAPASRVAEAFYRVRYGRAELTPEDHAGIAADLVALGRARAKRPDLG